MDVADLLRDGVSRGYIVPVEGGYEWDPTVIIPRSLSFKDVALVQHKNVCTSRLDVDISSEVIRGVVLAVPLLAANMSTVTNVEFCLELRRLGALGVLHRAWRDEEDYRQAVSRLALLSDSPHVAVSIGVGSEQVALARELVGRGANIVVIDIAHGYSDVMKETARAVKRLSRDVKVVVGNTTNLEMLYEFADIADALKIGIGQGYCCETKLTAGCTENQFSAVLKFKSEARRLGMPIISDGGTRLPVDFVKAVGAGASAVMAGSIFSACPESAAEVVNGKKIYAGMASRYTQDRWKGGLKPGTCPEGKVVELDIGEPAAALIERYSGALRSGITYAGATDIPSFQRMAEFILV